MNFGLFGKPIGLLAGSTYPRVIGPGFATFPGLPFSYAAGFGFAKPVASAFIAPWGVW